MYTDTLQLDPLARRPSDTPKSWQALQDYAAMGASRSLAKLAESYRNRTDSVPTRQESTLGKWSTTHDWQARVAAYDAQQAAADRAAREAALAEQRAAWIARHMEADEVLALLADQARGSIADVLKLPPLEASSDAPVGRGAWSLDLVKAQETGAIHLIKKIKETKYGTEVELYSAYDARVKLGEHHKLWKGDDILKYIDLNKLSPAQLERLAHGEDPLAVLLTS